MLRTLFTVASFVVDTRPQVVRHLSAVYVADTLLDEFRHDRVGAGVVPFAPIAAALEAGGNQGPTIIEIVAPNPDTAVSQSVSRSKGSSTTDRPVPGRELTL